MENLVGGAQLKAELGRNGHSRRQKKLGTFQKLCKYKKYTYIKKNVGF